MYAEAKFGEAQWAVTFNEDTTTEAYRISQFAFEAKRVAERGSHV